MTIFSARRKKSGRFARAMSAFQFGPPVVTVTGTLTLQTGTASCAKPRPMVASVNLSVTSAVLRRGLGQPPRHAAVKFAGHAG